DEIESAMRVLFADTHHVAEGAGAAAVAAVLNDRDLLRDRAVAVVLSGANVDPAPFGRVLLAEKAGVTPE
ncbi:MAG: hypothetical protein M3Q85_05770, partial [Acidobacteriota bacterium]|nr:hypothetical protein [Acidobacteriota bacterium]